MTSFNVNASLFARVVNAQSSEQTRYYLNGVCVQPAINGMPGVTMTATDGHILLSAYDPEGYASEAVIIKAPPHILKACAPYKNGTEPRMAGENGQISVTDKTGANQIATGVVIDASFPDWRRVIPQTIGSATSAVFNPDLVSTLAKGLRVARDSALKITGPGADSPHFVFGDEPRIFGVIMPIRDRLAAPSIPAWAALQAPSVAA